MSRKCHEKSEKKQSPEQGIEAIVILRPTLGDNFMENIAVNQGFYDNTTK